MNIKSNSVVYISILMIASVSVFFSLKHYYFSDSKEFDDIQPGVSVAVATVTEDTIPVFLTGIGDLEATQQVMVTAETDGLVTAILFKPGQRVKAGQALVQLNDAPEQGELTRLKAESILAKAQLARIRLLLRQQAATQDEFEKAQANWQQVQGEMARVQALIDQRLIRAPFSGKLGVRKVNNGQFVHAGDAMVSLVDDSVMYVNITLPEQVLSAVKKHQNMTIVVDAYPHSEFVGEVSTIESVVDRGTRTVLVQGIIQNQDGRLSSGMYANGKIKLSQPRNVILVPETAVTYNAYGDFIYAVDENKPGVFTARQIYVKTGERNKGYLEISGEVIPDQKVITSGQLRLSNGSVIKILPSDTLAVKNINTNQ